MPRFFPLLLTLGIGLTGLSCSTGSISKNGFDLTKATFPVREIRAGGPPRDGIPAIDRPRFETVTQADTWLGAEDVVVAVSLEGETRAYPLRILVWHEIVNDRIGSSRFAVTYCPLCGTAMVFDAVVGGRARTFGVSGLLFESDVLMYDRETESLWSQLAMEAASGPAVGQALELLPSARMTWEAWKTRHPDGVVLSRETGFRRDYARTPYGDYERTSRLLFPVPRHRADLENKDWVVGWAKGEIAVAFDLEALAQNGSARLETGRRQIEARYEPESGATVLRDRATGEELPSIMAYWFAWQAFYPETVLWSPAD